MEKVIEQAGAVSFKQSKNSFKILLIRARKDPDKWIFPKGHIEIGESAAIASERELLEEAGVVGASIFNLGNLEYTTEERKYQITYFINRFISSKDSGEPGREPTWFEYEQALNQLSYPNMKMLLKSAAPIIQQYID